MDVRIVTHGQYERDRNELIPRAAAHATLTFGECGSGKKGNIWNGVFAAKMEELAAPLVEKYWKY